MCVCVCGNKCSGHILEPKHCFLQVSAISTSPAWGFYTVFLESLAMDVGVAVLQKSRWASLFFFSLACSMTWICQPVASQLQLKKALRDSLSLTLSLLDNTQMFYKIEMRITWLTRKNEGRRFSLSQSREAAHLCASIHQEVKWSLTKWPTCQSKLATETRWLLSNQKEECRILHSVINLFIFATVAENPPPPFFFYFWSFAYFRSDERTCHQFKKAIAFRAVWFRYYCSCPCSDSNNGECARHA